MSCSFIVMGTIASVTTGDVTATQCQERSRHHIVEACTVEESYERSMGLLTLITIPILYGVSSAALKLATIMSVWVVVPIRLVPACMAVTVLLLTGWMPRAIRGSSKSKRSIFAARHLFISLALLGIVAYFVGNVFFQLALQALGVGLGVATVQAGLIIGGLVVGATLPNEFVRLRSVSTAALISLGIFLMSGDYSDVAGRDWQLVAAGVVYALLTGFCWTAIVFSLNLGRRNGLTSSQVLFVQTWTVLTLATAVAIASGFSLSESGIWWTYGELGPAGWAVVGGTAAAMAIGLSGVCLQRHSGVSVNTMSATSVVPSAFLGILLFEEPLSLAFVGGVLVVVVGIVGFYRGQPPPVFR